MLRDFSGAFWSEFKDIIHPCFDQAQTGGPCNNLGRLLTIFTHFLTGIFVLLDLEIGIWWPTFPLPHTLMRTSTLKTLKIS